jgi:polar amino acid transport system substrate-binding protein
MGVTADIKLYSWDEIIPALKNGEIDILTGGMSITPERALQISFSRPTAESGVTLAANIGKTKDIDSLDDLNNPDVNISVVGDTLSHSVAKTLFDKANVVVYATAKEAGQAAVSGDASAYLASLTQARFLSLNYPDSIDLPVADPLLASKEAIAVKKGEQELLNFLNAWVTARQADLWIATSRDYWFETLEWAEDLGAE